MRTNTSRYEPPKLTTCDKCGLHYYLTNAPHVCAEWTTGQPRTSGVETEPGSTAVSDPWAAVHRIKVKHEALVEAAIAAVNCYEWQGEQRARFLAEAMGELKTAVVAVRRLMMADFGSRWNAATIQASEESRRALVDIDRQRTLTCSECGFTEPLTERVTREVAEREGWLLGPVVYCPKHGPDDERERS